MLSQNTMKKTCLYYCCTFCRTMASKY